MNKKIVIFDLDGTLAIIDKRRDLARKPNGKFDWDVFHDASNISLDVPNTPVIKMAQLFAEDGFLIAIFSGRSDKTEHTTRSWLTRTRVPFHIDDVFLVVDDRQKVVDMWRDLGLTVFQVAPGDF